MKRYSSLIRKLVEATVRTEACGEDVADILKKRCFSDTDIVRQTLMNAVCDPRFKLFANFAVGWKNKAKNELEHLAEELSSHIDLSVEEADKILDDFLNKWLNMNVSELKIDVGTVIEHDYFAQQKEKINLHDAIGFLKEIESQDRQDMSNMNHEETLQYNNGLFVRNHSEAFYKELEERYLEKIPKSLTDLARKIGRVGKDNSYKSGKFLTAGKSDIAGITVGDDISTILPSELALLADARTEDVFYNKYSTKKLQLFASASHSQSHDRHEDGPIIICIDTSGSMSGEPVMIAKALAVTVAIIGWKRYRDVFVVKYSDSYDYRDFGHDHSRLGELSSFLSETHIGGNNENVLFSWLFKNEMSDFSKYDTADVLCISDFGWVELTNETREIIDEQKSRGTKFYGLNIGTLEALDSTSDYTDNDYSPMDVCDSVWIYEDGECNEIKRI